MCGIAGMMAAPDSPLSVERVATMAEALAHRGPDGRGAYAMDDVALAQTRLAIIDLATGDQPLHGPHRTALVANGEIYNYVELRQSLGTASFATQSDCEPPLWLYARDGLDYAKSLRGMYAIAVHDAARRELVLSRDPFGIKPLYVAETSAGLLFASEPRALVRAGVVPRLHGPAREATLQLHYAPGRSTIFESIERVLPGETLRVAGGRILERKRQEPVPSGPIFDIGEDEALARLEATLMDSVEIHQRSDVPYGLFLSGGVDSSAVLAAMARSGRKVRAYTIGFPGTGAHDERAQARRVARSVDADLCEFDFTARDFWGLLPQLADALDDPVADYACLPTYKLAREARRDVKVVLTGEGGDELFAGYGRYRRAMRPAWLKGGIRFRGAVDIPGLLRNSSMRWRDDLARRSKELEAAGHSRLVVAQRLDIEGWLPNDLLTKLDRCLMAHGLEGRTPFLDSAVADFAMRLPDGMKVRRGLGKWILRRWLDRVLPQSDAFARKRGFTVPAGEWIAEAGSKIGPLVARQPGIAEICVPGAVDRLFSRIGRDTKDAAWTLLFYALWHKRHIVGATPEGDAFEFLAA